MIKWGFNVTIRKMNKRQKLILEFSKENEEFQTKDIYRTI